MAGTVFSEELPGWLGSVISISQEQGLLLLGGTSKRLLTPGPAFSWPSRSPGWLCARWDSWHWRQKGFFGFDKRSVSCGRGPVLPQLCTPALSSACTSVLWNSKFGIGQTDDSVHCVSDAAGLFSDTSISWIFFCCLRRTIKMGLLQEIALLWTWKWDTWLQANTVLIVYPVQNCYLCTKKCFKSK